MQALPQKNTLNFNGRLVNLARAGVMGIINTTPDSFFSESRKQAERDVLIKAEQMLTEGALILDIGGYSTRPGADEIPVEEELARVIPVIAALVKEFPDAILSIDTFRAEVSRQAIAAGAHMINDISAGEDDPGMLSTVAELGVPYLIMHKQGTPKTMQKAPHYDDVFREVNRYLGEKIRDLAAMGVADVLVDPGFGFGKTMAHNYQLLSGLQNFSMLERPLVVGFSRKKMVQQIAGVDAEGALNGTTALHTIALMKGARLLRAHDVKEAVECIKLVEALHGNL